MDTSSPEVVQKSQKTKQILKWALVLGIVVVLNLFFNYAISLIYKAPVWENFCTSDITTKAYTDKAMCVADGGQWNETTVPISTDANGLTKPIPVGTEISGYCNATYSCQKSYDTAHALYDRNVFIVLVILGVLSLVAGTYLTTFSAVSFGLSFGGVISLLVGAMRYWSNMHDWLRVAVLAAALIALIWLGIKKIKE
jgi:ABC-type phosphate transport system permease subunit